jgi:type VI secretion system secreted protein VgrG
MSQPLGSTRSAEIATPLGPDVLLLSALTGREELGRLPEFVAEVIAKRADITPESLLGKTVTLRVALASGNRFYSGIVTRFMQLGESRGQTGDRNRWYSYRLIVHPWLWLLTRRSDCRAFQELGIPDICDKVLNRYGGTVIRSGLTGTYAPRAFCVQYRETDFNFVSRLWEQEGIYYHFKYQAGKADLVLIDGSGAHVASALMPNIEFHETKGAQATAGDCIEEFALTGEIQPGKYATTDFNFTQSRTSLLGESLRARSHPFADLDVFDYPGEYEAAADGAAIAGRRLEEFQSRHKIYHGSGNARGIEVGTKFTLQGHFHAALNRQYLAIAHSFALRVNPFSSAGGDASYRMSFTAIEATEQFRTERLTPRPVVQGLQTAIVTGPSGEQIHTDAHGRIRVQFHWDRYAGSSTHTGAADTSCWVRVSQGWAGKQWGMMMLPRVGQEVIVDFLEGDPDRPIVTGRVYNDLATPPYTLPDEKFKSTIKTLTEGGGFNEIRFDDKDGSEQIFVHAEKQLDIRVKMDKLEFIGANEHRIVTENVTEKIEGDRHQGIAGNLNEKVDGTVSLDAGQDLQVKIGGKYGADAGQEIHLKAGMKIVLEAAQIHIKAGSNSMVLGPSGVTIDGAPMTKINSGGSASSGSGASPEAPAEPEEADTGEPGQSTDPVAAPQPPAATTYTQQAMVLQVASASGAPFASAG